MTSFYIAAAGVGVLSILLYSSSLGLLCLALAGWFWFLDWCKGTYYISDVRLHGKLAVVTGANVGIGKAVAAGLANRGARVILACRDEKRATDARADIIKETGVDGSQVEFMKIDLSSFQSIRKFASELSKKETSLDILVNNAGVAFQDSPVITEDGQELVMQVNHFGNFLLTNLLSGMLSRPVGGSRVVMVSSLAHAWPKHGIQYNDLTWKETPYSMTDVYGQSKLCNIFFAKEFGRRFADKGIRTYAVHPGAVITELGREVKKKIPTILQPISNYFASLVLKTIEGGAQTILYCAVDPSVSSETGLYYAECQQKTSSALSQDPAEAAKLWTVSEQIVGDISPASS